MINNTRHCERSAVKNLYARLASAKFLTGQSQAIPRLFVFLLLFLGSSLVFNPYPLSLYNAYASDIGSTKISYTTGKKSQTSGIEDRDLSGHYEYNKYRLSVKAEPKEDFYYRASYQYYHKDFDSKNDDLNNRTNLYNAYFSVPVHKTDKASLSLNADYKLRAKRYKNSPSNEYDNNNLSAGINLNLQEIYTLKLSGGVKDYEYIKKSSSDTLKTFFKIAPKAKLFDKRLSLSGYYRRDMVDQSDSKKDYSEDCVSFRSTYKLDKPLIEKVSGHFSYGRNDTRDDNEDREDNLRYEYQLWDVTLYSKPFERIKGKVTYGQKHRKYFTSINGYDNWYIDKTTTIELLKKDSLSVDMLIGGIHKETKFYENQDLSYDKNSLSAGFNITKRSDFSIKPSFKYTRYKYPPLSTKNEKDYKASVNCRKYIGSTDKCLEAGYWYEWKNYEYKPNSCRWNLSLSFTLSF